MCAIIISPCYPRKCLQQPCLRATWTFLIPSILHAHANMMSFLDRAYYLSFCSHCTTQGTGCFVLTPFVPSHSLVLTPFVPTARCKELTQNTGAKQSLPPSPGSVWDQTTGSSQHRCACQIVEYFLSLNSHCLPAGLDFIHDAKTTLRQVWHQELQGSALFCFRLSMQPSWSPLIFFLFYWWRSSTVPGTKMAPFLWFM
jgi:hypothetical protein